MTKENEILTNYPYVVRLIRARKAVLCYNCDTQNYEITNNYGQKTIRTEDEMLDMENSLKENYTLNNITDGFVFSNELV